MNPGILIPSQPKRPNPSLDHNLTPTLTLNLYRNPYHRPTISAVMCGPTHKFSLQYDSPDFDGPGIHFLDCDDSDYDGPGFDEPDMTVRVLLVQIMSIQIVMFQIMKLNGPVRILTILVVMVQNLTVLIMMVHILTIQILKVQIMTGNRLFTMTRRDSMSNDSLRCHCCVLI